MEKKKLDWIVQLIREQMMTTGSVPGKPGFSNKANAKGPTAGYDPVIGKVEKRRKLLSYLRRKDNAKYQELIASLGLRR